MKPYRVYHAPEYPKGLSKPSVSRRLAGQISQNSVINYMIVHDAIDLLGDAIVFKEDGTQYRFEPRVTRHPWLEAAPAAAAHMACLKWADQYLEQWRKNAILAQAEPAGTA